MVKRWRGCAGVCGCNMDHILCLLAENCAGYTESHYRGLVQLYEQFKASPVGFNILAFPCNQFGEQE